ISRFARDLPKFPRTGVEIFKYQKWVWDTQMMKKWVLNISFLRGHYQNVTNKGAVRKVPFRGFRGHKAFGSGRTIREVK
ncbi:MAG: hypothetical protein K9H15_16390, partial [Bacteroidales bacterium]|nr:hypothetical protein [Bacteroidales bacterium]